MEVKVSVIVPVYNVELYLGECLDSIINQTFEEMEIILVNDGSTDRSSEIMAFYASKDSRIIPLSQPNSGVSAARNAGIKQSSGQYILFVDSDDTLSPDTIEVLYRKAKETGADIVMGNALYCYPDGRQLVFFPQGEAFYHNSVWTGESAFIQFMEGDRMPLVVMYFIRRDIILNHQLFFQEKIVHEDEIWCVKAILSAQKMVYLKFNYYYYRQREDSIMNSDNKAYRVKSLFEVAKALDQYTETLQKKDASNEVIACVYVRIFWVCHFINTLIFQTKTVTFHHSDYFSGLLIKIYPLLSYSQQRYCLGRFCVSLILGKHNYETDSNLSIYD